MDLIDDEFPIVLLDFKLISLFLFAFFINNIFKKLNQEIPLLLFIISISSIRMLNYTHQNFINILLYASGCIQVIRLEKTFVYRKLRSIRIIGGPIFGCLLFWRILNNYSFFTIDLFGLVLYLIGLHFRPSINRENYKQNRKIHGFFMGICFASILFEDFFLHN